LDAGQAASSIFDREGNDGAQRADDSKPDEAKKDRSGACSVSAPTNIARTAPQVAAPPPAAEDDSDIERDRSTIEDLQR